jgi:hypothetical protein
VRIAADVVFVCRPIVMRVSNGVNVVDGFYQVPLPLPLTFDLCPLT